jgi:nucleotide-binding universal stress UspA family protein
MLENVLVPLDGSAYAEAALGLAQLIPSERIRLVNVRSDLTQLDEICESAHEGEAYLERVAESLRQQGRSVATDVVFGDPQRQIVALSALADLVVMGSHGCGATHTFFLGSVADWVARHAPVPTLIVRAGEQPASAVHVTRILVPLDGSALAEASLPMARRLAADLGVPIHLVRVVDFDIVRASVEAGAEAAQDTARAQDGIVRQANAYLAEQVQALRDQDLLATSEVRSGAPATELLAAAREGDLIVLTTRERGGLARWLLGSVADELVRRAPGPVLLVRAGAGQDDRRLARGTSAASVQANAFGDRPRRPG